MTASGSVFEDSAAVFAAGIDAEIERHAYRRGELFQSAVCKWIVHGGHILDYGCGPGRISRLMAHCGYRVLGVDPAAAMIQKAREQSPAGDLQFALLSSDCLAGAAYDGIVCSSVIEYVPGPDELLLKFRASLRCSGKLILSFANAKSLWGIYSRWRSPEAPHLRLQRNVWKASECERVLHAAGFRIIDGPRFFDSPFDQVPWLSWLSVSQLIGTLGLIIAEPSSGAVH